MKSALLMDNDIARDLKKNSADIKSLSERNYDSSSTPRGVQQIKQSSIAYRMMVELVVGMVFGFAAGIRVMLQTANQINIVKDQSEERL